MAVGSERTLLNVNYRNCLSADTKPTTAKDGDLLYALDTNVLYEYNGNQWRAKDTNAALLGAIQAMHSALDESIQATTLAIQNISNAIDSGIATDGSTGSLVDSNKEFQTNLFNDKIIKITIDGVTYYRTILTCTEDSLTFADVVAPVESSATVGAGNESEGQVIISCIGLGAGGDDYSVEFVAGTGVSSDAEATLADNVLTIHSATNGSSEPILVAAGNVKGIIEANENLVGIFTANEDVKAGNINFTAEPIAFTGGSDGISVTSGDVYQIIRAD